MENYRINLVSKTLIISAAFEKAMNVPTSDEYRFYVQLQHDIPGLKVARRTHKSPTKYHTQNGEIFHCNQYKHLTYENIINALPKRDELLKVYRYIRDKAGPTQTSPYTAVRRWFVAQFPYFRDNPLFYFNNDYKIITDIESIIQSVQEESAKVSKSA